MSDANYPSDHMVYPMEDNECYQVSFDDDEMFGSRTVCIKIKSWFSEKLNKVNKVKSSDELRKLKDTHSMIIKEYLRDNIAKIGAPISVEIDIYRSKDYISNAFVMDKELINRKEIDCDIPYLYTITHYVDEENGRFRLFSKCKFYKHNIL